MKTTEGITELSARQSSISSVISRFHELENSLLQVQSLSEFARQSVGLQAQVKEIDHDLQSIYASQASFEAVNCTRSFRA